MPKTGVKKIENEDLRELGDESLDRVDPLLICAKSGICISPSD